MFAYYQSALVVEFLVQRYGHRGAAGGAARSGRAGWRSTRRWPRGPRRWPSWRRRSPRSPGSAPRRWPPRPTSPSPTCAALRGRRGRRWRPAGASSTPTASGRWSRRRASSIERGGEHAKARPLLERAIALHPEQRGADSAYLLLAVVHRKLGQTAEERQGARAAGGDLASDAAARLRPPDRAGRGGQGLTGAGAATPTACWGSTRWPRRAGGRWGGRSRRPDGGAGGRDRAVAAYERLLLLEPADQVDTRYRLAKLLRGRNARARQAAPAGGAGRGAAVPRGLPAAARAGRQPARDGGGPMRRRTAAAADAGGAAGRRGRLRPDRRRVPRSTAAGSRCGRSTRRTPRTSSPSCASSTRRSAARAGAAAGSTDYPASDLNLSYRLQQLTSLKVNPNPKVLELTDPALLDYPFIYVIEPGGMSLSDEEVDGAAPLPAGRAAS